MDPAQERKTTITQLLEATARLAAASLNPVLIPPEGISFGFAMRGARENSGVAAVKGGIPGSVAGSVPGTADFGTEEPVVRIILTMMKFDPHIRSAALLQYSDRALGIFEDDLFLDCTSPGPGLVSQGISTMDWRIASCCKDDIPDIIVLKNRVPEESRIVLSGESPAVVANNIIICSNRI